MPSKWKIGSVLLIALLVLGGLVINRIEGQADTAAVDAGMQAVKTSQVEQVSRQNALRLTGTVDAAEKALITARVAGIIEALPVDNGASIQPGQTLAQIDSQPYSNLVEVSQANLTQAQVKLDSTRSLHERVRQLYEAGAASTQDYEDAQAALRAAQADVSKAQSALHNAQRDLGYTRVTSPISGVVANLSALRGQMVAVGTPLMEVHHLAEVNIIVAVGQSELGQIKTGMEAEISVDAYAEQSFRGTLETINPAASPQARVFQCKVRVPNPDGLLKAGMFANVVIYSGEARTVLSVPEKALTSKQGQFYVFVPAENTAHLAAVEIGEIFDGRVEIIKGLEAGQDVIVSNVNQLKEGDHIKILPDQGV